MPHSQQQSADHDLLIELRTEMRGMRNDIKELKDGTAGQLADHEIRLRSLEKASDRWLGKQSIIGGIIGVGAALVSGIAANFWR